MKKTIRKKTRRQVKTKTKAGTIDVMLGQRLRAARQSAALSMDDLGEAIGVTYQQIQKYETGRNRISCSCLIQLAPIVGRPITYFFEGVK